jgi:hypothetical protein
MKRIDLTGKVYGRLTVKEYDKSKKERLFWICQCECGKIVSISGEHLRRGLTHSCGCFRKELSSMRLKKTQTKHGLSRTTLYRKFTGMKRRCYSVKDKHYVDYGGRGIKIYDEWLKDFQKFYDWSISNGYKPGLSIDRIDNNDGYYPWNCRYVDIKKQQNNKRNNKIIIFKGEAMCVNDWSRKTKIPSNVISSRLRMGWSVKDALTRRVEKHKPKFHMITFNGETLNVAQWARKRCIQAGTLRARLRKGWSIEQALTVPVLSQRRNNHE